jgi:hypothetical protein
VVRIECRARLALATRAVEIEGDPAALSRFVEIFRLAAPRASRRRRCAERTRARLMPLVARDP